MKRFEGQVAVVTGAATGIGFGIAARLGREGARVLVVDHDGPLGERSVGELSAMGIEARLEVGDVGEADVAARAVGAASDAWGRIDVLVLSWA